MKRSILLLTFLVIALFIPSVLEIYLNVSISPTIMQAIGFSITLIGFFIGASFEFSRLEKQFLEERQKEKRLQKLAVVDSIEVWVSEFTNVIEDLGTLAELSPKDETDGKLVIDGKKKRTIAERLLRLDYQWMTVFGKSADLIGIKKDDGKKWDDYREEHRELLEHLYVFGNSITQIREMLTGDRVPKVIQYSKPLVEIKRAIDKIRLSID